MDTHAEFRTSERETLGIRLAVVAGALLFGLVTGADLIGVVVLAVAFAFYTVVLQFILLSRFHSDRWIYGMMGADLLFTGGAATILGLPGPVIAIPALFAAQYALFLGYRGASISAVLGITATLSGGIIAGGFALDAISATVPVISGAAALSGYIASSRFSERSARREAQLGNNSDARAARLFDGLRPISSANDETSALEAFARSILTITGFDAIMVYTRSNGLQLQRRVLLKRENEDNTANDSSGDFEESMDGESAAARAAAQGVALALGIGNPASEGMPGWATRMGYKSGVVAPMIVGPIPAGVVFGLCRDENSLTLEQIDQIERFVSLSARLVVAHNSGTQSATRDRLSLELDAAGRTELGESRPIIKMDGLTLDPATDRSSVVGVPVSLSRSEFDLLYALAATPGQVMDPGSLIESAFGDAPDGGQRAVDTTLYRLRRKLSRAPEGEDLIRTIRGKGYLLMPPSAEKVPEDLSNAVAIQR
ncbi:MAG: winged helix-turn-helix domain-containing protein [Dehalococcoidia bacterium]|nr:winged helix-turn-helix domain-containing protein [Dehalococcoidia bacterium]